SPEIVRVNGPAARVLQLSGPKTFQVIEPPAAAPGVIGLITGLPGWFAVPVIVAVSLIELPSVTVPLATCVVSCGVTGFTVKHSVVLVVSPGSAAFGHPVVLEVKPPRQQ